MLFGRQEIGRQEMNEDNFVENYNQFNTPVMEQPGLGPIIEPPIQRYVKRDFVHEVNHICPINTKVINNHIYKHNYTPQYCCCEEDIVTNIDCGSCCNFMR